VPPLDGQCPPDVHHSPVALHDPTLPRETGRNPLRAEGLAPAASALASSCVRPPTTSARLAQPGRCRPKSTTTVTGLATVGRRPHRPDLPSKRLALPVLPASACPATDFVPPRAHARGFPLPMTNVPRGWPGLLPHATGAEAPATRDPRPRRSQHRDHVMPNFPQAETRVSSITPQFAPLGDASALLRPPPRPGPARRRAETRPLPDLGSRPLPVSSRHASPSTSACTLLSRLDRSPGRIASRLPSLAGDVPAAPRPARRTEARRSRRVLARPPALPPRPLRTPRASGPKPIGDVARPRPYLTATNLLGPPHRA
jgi:hypothetical protein